jgi:hypothetical protein
MISGARMDDAWYMGEILKEQQSVETVRKQNV